MQRDQKSELAQPKSHGTFRTKKADARAGLTYREQARQIRMPKYDYVYLNKGSARNSRRPEYCFCYDACHMHKIWALKRKADEDEGRAKQKSKKKGKRGGKSKKEKKKAKTEEKHKQGRKEGEKTKEETENEEEDTESEEEDSPFLKLYNDRRSGIKNSIVWVVSREQRQP